MTPFQLVYGQTVTTPLDAMLPVSDNVEHKPDISDFTQRAEEARHLARHRIQQQQRRTSTTCGEEKSSMHQVTEYGYRLPYKPLASPKSFTSLFRSLPSALPI